MLRDIYLRSKHNLDVALHTVRAFLFFVFFFLGGGVKRKHFFCLFKFTDFWITF